jgi:hypothetical protein
MSIQEFDSSNLEHQKIKGELKTNLDLSTRIIFRKKRKHATRTRRNIWKD